jgi:serine-type D-Ala-D-Ala endopeptidase (penicillin-binding protein 7)
MKRLWSYNVPLYLAVLAVAAIGLLLVGYGIHVKRSAAHPIVVTTESDGKSEPLEFGSIPALADEDFFNTVHNKFIAEKSTFIEANLSKMELHYYVDGVEQLSFPILTKGREGSWWETPAGLYKVESKIKNHFSAFAKVNLPWSMPFQGNFFIHGWPYYPDGTPVSSQYSGGCIRLSTDDAKKLYDQVSAGTPLLVFEKDFARDDFKYDGGVTGVSAESYLAADIGNNTVFTEHNSREVKPIYSITKLVTALVAVEYINIERDITITQPMIIPTSKARLVVGQDYSVYDLLHPLLMESSNEAAEAIARSLGRDYFIGLMNQKAKAIGMDHTTFVDPSGKSAENVSTAQDLFVLAKYLYNNRSFILNMSAGKDKSAAYGPSLFQGLQNFNVFADDEDFVGGKVGVRDVGGYETIMSVFSTNLGTESGEVKRPIVMIALDTPDNAKDATRLLSWTRDTY